MNALVDELTKDIEDVGGTLGLTNYARWYRRLSQLRSPDHTEVFQTLAQAAAAAAQAGEVELARSLSDLARVGLFSAPRDPNEGKIPMKLLWTPVSGTTDCGESIPLTAGTCAMKDMGLAACFLSRFGGDWLASPGLLEGTPYLCERVPRAIERRYRGVPGALCLVASDGFVVGRSPWKFIPSGTGLESATILDRILVDDALAYIESLNEDGCLAIYRFPNRPPHVPQDDSDLVLATSRMIEEHNADFLPAIEALRPDLVRRIRDLQRRPHDEQQD